MKSILILLLIFSATISLAQSKYFIYFKNKGVSSSVKLSKTSQQFIQAENELSTKSLERRKKVMGEDYIRYEDLPVLESYVNQIENEGIEIENKLKWFNAVSAYLTPEQRLIVSEFPFVEKIEEVKTLKYKNTPQFTDAFNPLTKYSQINYNLDYGLSLAQLELSDIPIIHDLGITGENVIIGVLDSGFDWMNHPSLQNQNIIAEYDFVFDDSVTSNEPEDNPGQHNHGTHVLSIVGGFDEGDLIGASYNSSFLLAKTEDITSETHIEEDNYAAALEWMEGLGVDITTSSLGYSNFNSSTFSYTYADMNGNSTIVTRASELSFERGVVSITSAGNEGNTSWKYITAPADGFFTIAVGAALQDGRVAGFSSRGPTYDGRLKPEIITQGNSVLGARASNGEYSLANGTSSAAPIAVGVAGLLLSAYPHLANMQIRKIFRESGDISNNPDTARGYGLLSALRALTYPNLKKENNNYVVNKIFVDSNGVNNQSVQINYGKINETMMNGSMNLSGNLIFNFTLPEFIPKDTIQFYFTYEDTSGNSVRVPESDNYKIVYGKDDVSLNTSLSDEFIPVVHILSQNYPNPFNSFTRIRYGLPVPGNVNLRVYNILGQEVATLVNWFQDEGTHTVFFKSKNLASGVYIYRIQVGDFVADRKMVLLK